MSYSFTDIHQHLLFGLDDGARDEAQMYTMLELSASDGIARIVATPHVTPGVEPFNDKQFALSLEKARKYCRNRKLNIELQTGCEILYTDQTVPFLRDGRVHTLADSDRALVEFGPTCTFAYLYSAICRLQDAGYVPVLAHVERYQCLTRMPGRAERLLTDTDVRFQVNCSTVLKARDILTTHFVRRLLRRQSVSAIASDAHNTESRRVHMTKAWEVLSANYGEAYANALTDGSVLMD